MKLVPETSPVFRLLLLAFLPLLAVALLVTYLAPEVVLNIAYCPLREITGFPCPTCGGTLTATHLTQGRWLAALHANPAIVLAAATYMVAAGYALIVTLKPAWRRTWLLNANEKKTARLMAVLLLILNWSWLIRVYLF